MINCSGASDVKLLNPEPRLDFQSHLNKEWAVLLSEELNKPYMKYIAHFLFKQYSTLNIYPSKELLFNALNLCSYIDVKLVILGQDPYYTPNTAHGLAFSSLQLKTPASLRNMFTEIQSSLPNYFTFLSNNLTSWSKQGALLLNTILTVEEGHPKIHDKIGWQFFISTVITLLNNKQNKIIYLLWGKDAQKYKHLIDTAKHTVLETTHPSPLSAYKGFIGCNHFKLAYDFIKTHYNINFDFSTY